MDRGQLIGGVEDERLYWFSEGFTDYYASLLLLRAGLISLEDHVAGYNSLIKEYVGTCAIAEVNNYHPWDMGFEADTSFKTRVISGVAPDSNAHRAGLRDGQKWVSGGFVHGDPGRLTKLTVIEGDTQKVVQLSRGHRSDPPATVQAEAGYFG